MAKSLKILGVHGLGDQRLSDWQSKWPEAVRRAFPAAEGVDLEFEFIVYDDIFEKTDISPWETMGAVAKLAASGISSVFKRHRGVLGDVSEKIRWTAGYVVAWVEDDGFKARTRKRVFERIKAFEPDVILAHSLGSLVTYNAFTHPEARAEDVAALLRKATYVTFGSQINNPFVVRNLTNGRVQPLEVAAWRHLYNEHDDVFTAPIRNWPVANFRQIETPFDEPGIGDHSAEAYLGHNGTVDNLWRPLADALDGKGLAGARAFAGVAGAASGKAKSKARAEPRARSRRRKALLVGINDYPEASQRLEGCVNDVFTMSAMLQERGFEPEAIRTCLDGRATADGILSRLRWLLDEPAAGDELVFYYSGHGAQIPEYGEDFEPDHNLEVLVPWDFDWTPERAVSDDQIHGLYAQLPYDTRLAMIFDCCHAGGLHRDGAARARGITPPDDIRHRQLRWDKVTGMWVPRSFRRINSDFTTEPDVARRYFGRDGATERLGRAAMLRGLSVAENRALQKANAAQAEGPYLPLIIEACGEGQLSYEYRHGVISHGAFTFSLANILRRERDLTFGDLVARARSQLVELGYDQVPQILGPSAVVDARVIGL